MGGARRRGALHEALHHRGHGGRGAKGAHDVRSAARATRLIRSVLCVLSVLRSGELIASAAVADYLGKPVASVRFIVEGREVTEPTFAQIVETTVEQPLSMVQVRESIGQLFSLGRFEDVSVDASLENGRVELRYLLTPIHPVTRLRFT